MKARDICKAAKEGQRLQAHFPDAQVHPPGAQPVTATVVLTWSQDSGPHLEVFAREPLLDRAPRPQHPGERLGIDDLWTVTGSTSDGLQLEASRLIVSTERDASGIPLPADADRTRIKFKPQTVVLLRQRASEFPVCSRVGQLQMRTRKLFFPFPTHTTSEGPFGHSEGTRRDCIKGPLADGAQFVLQKNGLWQCGARVTGSSRDQLDSVASHLELGVGFATGVAAQWQCYVEETEVGSKICLSRPRDLVSHRSEFALLPYPVDPAPLLQAFSVACGRHAQLVEHLGALHYCWEANEASIHVSALAACTVLEGLVQELKTHLPEPTTEAPPRVQCDQLLELIEGSALADTALARRTAGFLERLPAPRATDRFYALRDLGVFTEKEIKAWNKLRNSLAHGAYGTSPERVHKVFRRLLHVTNMTNKLILLVIGYRGPYRDYSEVDWPTREFGSEPTVTIKAIPLE
ncbi:MAG: hypothetical protein JKY65_27950 [Planctomycetes bacterium]|nr:hypothetical protein [Planctomycetota bacterium]